MTFAIVNGEQIEVLSEDALLFDSHRSLLAEQARVSAIKSEAARLIETVAPIHRQQNYAALRISLLTRRIAGEAILDGELEDEREALSVASKIEEIRSISKSAVRDGVAIDSVKWPS